jgi:tetratricopeptide (TPR) repeat protein
VEGDFRNARLEAEISIALDPNNADAHNALSYVLTLQGRPEESLSSSRRAIALNPGAPEFYFFSMAEALVASKRYQEALAVCDRILAKRPDWLMARILRALALEGLGNFEEAKKEIRTLLDISPRFTAGRWKRAIMYPDRPDVPDLMARLVSIGLPE